MKTVELSLMGWLLAQVCRSIGMPLAPYRGLHVPVEIELIPDPNLQGIARNRRYNGHARTADRRSFSIQPVS